MENTILLGIREKKILSFDYKGFQRIAEPHVYGIKDRDLQLLAYQIAGKTSEGLLPDWRRFSLKLITNLKITNQNFAGKRPFPSGKHSQWDKQIAVVS